jgi:diacylglycerol kinase family enzyme
MLKKINDKIFYVVTRNLEEVRDAFEQYIEDFTVFVIVGGDGSVNESLKYLVNRSDKYLAVYPNGSGNGFAKELGFKKNIRSLIHDIQRGDSMDLDIVRINNTYSINASGVGIDSYVAHEFSNTRKRGLVNYIILTIKSFFAFRPFKAKITSTEFNVHGYYQMITIANTRQFGNNAFIAPMAKPNDGIIDLVLVKPFPIFLFPLFAVQLFLGNLKKTRYIDFIKTKNPITIDSQYNVFHVDGEPVNYDRSINVSMDQNKICVIRTVHNQL